MIILDADDLRNSKLTWSLIIFNVIWFIFFITPVGGNYLFLFVQTNNKIINDLEVWRLFTAMFLHSDIMHLFSNMFGLLLFGALVENNFSKSEYLFIYFISGLIGNTFSLFLLPIFSISLGASGAIFGLLGASFVLIAFENPSLLVLALVYVMFFLTSSFAPGINAWAHIFGLIGGIGLGYVFRKLYHPEVDYYA
ncbi:MAG: rhomboid family intramembrane serine protease [Promethearchaeota archaeon]|nr:MAG: rhomboid family intramembrane serine protease [Candidatus Lokiarchaeota archaeon]